MNSYDLESQIYFFSEDTDFKLDKLPKYKNWIIQIASSELETIKNINYIFCSDSCLLEINQEHLNHDYLTDIITFPIQEDPIVSDIFISIDRVQDNALTHKVSFTQELHRVMAHGILHLCGYKDKTIDEKTMMRQKEEFYMNALDKLI